MHDVPYRKAVSALNWAALATRPDIAFAVTTVAWFSANPGMAHWGTVKRIFVISRGHVNCGCPMARLGGRWWATQMRMGVWQRIDV